MAVCVSGGPRDGQKSAKFVEGVRGSKSLGTTAVYNTEINAQQIKRRFGCIDVSVMASQLFR